MPKLVIGAAILSTFVNAACGQSALTDVAPELRINYASAPALDAPNPTPLLTLEDVQRIAFENNPLLRSARSEADATMGSLIQAGARPNPEVSILQEGFSGNERTSTGLITQRIELGGQRAHRLDAASYAREGALASIDGRLAALRADVASAFYGVLFAQKQVELTRDSADIAARSAQLVERRAVAGKVSPVEVTRAKVAATEAQIALSGATAYTAAAQEKLASTVGSFKLKGRDVSGDPEVLPVPIGMTDLQRRVENSPTGRRTLAEIGRSNALASLERARRTPDVTVSAGMKRIVTGGAPSNQVVVGVSIPLPFFDTNRGALLEARHRADKAESDRDAELAQLRFDVALAYASYESASEEARRLKGEALPGAREALDSTSRGFELGKFSYLDVLDAQRTLFQMRSQYLKALITARQSYADLERYLGNVDVSSASKHSQPEGMPWQARN